jgi:hypothetical protein
VRTRGCQMNVHDSERIAGLLDDAGHASVADGAQPDVVVFRPAPCARTPTTSSTATSATSSRSSTARPACRSPSACVACSPHAAVRLRESQAHDGRGGGGRHEDRGPVLLQGHQRRRNRIGHPSLNLQYRHRPTPYATSHARGLDRSNLEDWISSRSRVNALVARRPCYSSSAHRL